MMVAGFHSCPGVAKLLLEYGANINTHSNEFKESALTLACYKGHLEMVKFLLGAGWFGRHEIQPSPRDHYRQFSLSIALLSSALERAAYNVHVHVCLSSPPPPVPLPSMIIAVGDLK